MRTALVLGAVAVILMACSTASAAWYVVGPVKVVTPTTTYYYGPAVTVYQPPVIAPAPVVRVAPAPAPVIVRPRPVRRVHYHIW